VKAEMDLVQKTFYNKCDGWSATGVTIVVVREILRVWER